MNNDSVESIMEILEKEDTIQDAVLILTFLIHKLYERSKVGFYIRINEIEFNERSKID